MTGSKICSEISRRKSIEISYSDFSRTASGTFITSGIEIHLERKSDSDFLFSEIFSSCDSSEGKVKLGKVKLSKVKCDRLPKPFKAFILSGNTSIILCIPLRTLGFTDWFFAKFIIRIHSSHRRIFHSSIKRFKILSTVSLSYPVSYAILLSFISYIHAILQRGFVRRYKYTSFSLGSLSSIQASVQKLSLTSLCDIILNLTDINLWIYCHCKFQYISSKGEIFILFSSLFHIPKIEMKWGRKISAYCRSWLRNRESYLVKIIDIKNPSHWPSGEGDASRLKVILSEMIDESR